VNQPRGKADIRSTLNYHSVLGISEDASQDEIEARYRELADHMASPTIPATLRDWANREAALFDEAYAVLSDPDRRAALDRTGASVESGAANANESLRPTDQSVQAVAPAKARRQSEPETAASEPAGQRERPTSAARALVLGVPWKLVAVGAVAGVVVLGAVFFGRGAIPGLGGGDSSSAAAASNSNGFTPIDPARLAQLTAQVQAAPTDIEALYGLGEMYFEAGDWQTSIDWLTKMLAQDPNNISAQTDLGTASFNLGNFDVAKQTWLKALATAPSDPQLHYNLGFFYANVSPVDMQAATNEWRTVVQLAPGSALANTVQVHLDSLASLPSPQVTESPAVTAPPAATAAPASP
jgi:cytochrome c-type biogenesis protein CcmH/NrfG